MKKIFLKENYIDWFYMTIGIALASFGFSFFINPRNVVTGGVSGVGVLLKNIFNGFDPALTILILNILLLIIGLFFVGKDFFIKTAYGSLAFPFFIKVFDFIYVYTDPYFNNIDMVLVILFSSIISGIGLGLTVKHGGSTGGTEVLQRIVFKYMHIPFSTSLFLFDGAIILLGMIILGNVEMSLYAIVFTFLTGVVMDMVVFSGFNRRAVYIISKQKDLIRHKIIDSFNRGVTSIQVIGEYSKEEKTMLMCVLSTNEYYKLRQIIEEYDDAAFYYAVRASEVRGEGFSYDISRKRKRTITNCEKDNQTKEKLPNNDY